MFFLFSSHNSYSDWFGLYYLLVYPFFFSQTVGYFILHKKTYNENHIYYKVFRLRPCALILSILPLSISISSFLIFGSNGKAEWVLVPHDSGFGLICFLNCIFSILLQKEIKKVKNSWTHFSID
jgi:Na+/alanine symporter